MSGLDRCPYRQTPGTRVHRDVPLEQWKSASLLYPSIVRLAKIATVDYRLVERRLGKLQDADRRRVRAKVAEIFQAWM